MAVLDVVLLFARRVEKILSRQLDPPTTSQRHKGKTRTGFPPGLAGESPFSSSVQFRPLGAPPRTKPSLHFVPLWPPAQVSQLHSHKHRKCGASNHVGQSHSQEQRARTPGGPEQLSRYINAVFKGKVTEAGAGDGGSWRLIPVGSTAQVAQEGVYKCRGCALGQCHHIQVIQSTRNFKSSVFKIEVPPHQHTMQTTVFTLVNNGNCGCSGQSTCNCGKDCTCDNCGVSPFENVYILLSA